MHMSIDTMLCHTNTFTGMMDSITTTNMMVLVVQRAIHTGTNTILQNTTINTGPTCTIGMTKKKMKKVDYQAFDN